MRCFKEIPLDETPVYVGKFMVTFHADCFACGACKGKIEDPTKFSCKGNELFHEKCAAT